MNGMKGSIQKKGKVFYAVIAIRGKRKWYKGGETKKDAQRVLNEKLGEIEAGTFREIPKKNFGDFATHWLETYPTLKALKPATVRSFRDVVQRLLIPRYGDLLLSDITTERLEGYVSERLGEVSAKTVWNELTVLKLLFKGAYKKGYIKSNPAAKESLERPKREKPQIEILSPDEVQRFLSKAEGPYRVAFLVAIHCGLRAGELWGLQWGDIDWTSKQIHVRRSLWRDNSKADEPREEGDRFFFQRPKSERSIRRVDVSDSLLHELKVWKLACPQGEYDLVFPSGEGTPTYHDNVVKRHFNSTLSAAKLRRVSFHSLRHTNASIRIKAGQNVKYIQAQMGHASIKVTMDIYGHLFEDMEFSRQQVGLFEEALSSVRKPLEDDQKERATSTVTL